MPEKTTKKRPIDSKVAKSYSWWGKSFVFIQKRKIKTWQAVFIVAFIAGVVAAMIWSISYDIHSYSEAAVADKPIVELSSPIKCASDDKNNCWGHNLDYDKPMPEGVENTYLLVPNGRVEFNKTRLGEKPRLKLGVMDGNGNSQDGFYLHVRVNQDWFIRNQLIQADTEPIFFDIDLAKYKNKKVKIIMLTRKNKSKTGDMPVMLDPILIRDEAKKPDLFVRGDLFDFFYIKDNEANINITVEDINKANEDYRNWGFKITLNGRSETFQDGHGLGTNYRSNFSINVTDYIDITKPGTYEAVISADPKNLIDESNENNNTLIKQIKITGVLYSNIEASNVSSNSVQINWNSNIAGDETVAYHTSWFTKNNLKYPDPLQDVIRVVSQPGNKTEHSMLLEGLEPKTTYYYRVRTTNSQNPDPNFNSLSYFNTFDTTDSIPIQIDLKTDDPKADNDTYLIAGNETRLNNYLGELEITGGNEGSVINELILENHGTATDGDIALVHLYDNSGNKIASRVPTTAGDAIFNGLNISVPANQTISWFIGVTAKTINADGDSTGTAAYGRTIQYGLENDDALSKKATIVGSRLTSITNNMPDGILAAGNNRVIGKYKLIFDNGDNRTPDNMDIMAELKDLKLTIASTSMTYAKDVQAYIEGDASNKTDIAHVYNNQVFIDLTSLDNSAEQVDGEVVLVIEADVTTSGTDQFIQTMIDNLNIDFTYNGNSGIGANLIKTADDLGISSVRGATLAN